MIRLNTEQPKQTSERLIKKFAALTFQLSRRRHCIQVPLVERPVSPAETQALWVQSLFYLQQYKQKKKTVASLPVSLLPKLHPPLHSGVTTAESQRRPLPGSREKQTCPLGWPVCLPPARTTHTLRSTTGLQVADSVKQEKAVRIKKVT